MSNEGLHLDEEASSLQGRRGTTLFQDLGFADNYGQ